MLSTHATDDAGAQLPLASQAPLGHWAWRVHGTQAPATQAGALASRQSRPSRQATQRPLPAGSQNGAPPSARPAQAGDAPPSASGAQATQAPPLQRGVPSGQSAAEVHPASGAPAADATQRCATHAVYGAFAAQSPAPSQ
jgi:hypothetical protein